MAFEEAVELRSAQIGAVSLAAAANLFKVVKFDANGELVAVAAITDVPAGVLYDTGVVGATVPYAVAGIAKVKAGATITPGAMVATKADGTLQVAVATQTVIGMARLGGVTGDVIPVELTLPGFIKA